MDRRSFRTGPKNFLEDRSVQDLKIAKRTSKDLFFNPETTDYGHPMKAQIKDIWKIGPMWQTKYAAAVPKNLGVGVNFRPCSEGYLLSGRP